MKPSKSLIVMRHGHAEDGSGNYDGSGQGCSDYERPLSDSGKRGARRVGLALYESGIRLNCVLASSAPRAAHSAQLAAEACQFKGQISVRRELYLAPAEGYSKALRTLSDDVQTVLLVGHNPGLSHLVEQLTGQGCSLAPAEYVRLSVELPHWSEFGGKKR